MIDIILGRTLGGRGDGALGLTLGADEQNATAARSHFAYLQERLMEQRKRLRQVDNVDVGTRTEQVTLHLGVPAVSLVTEVRTRFEEQTHRDFWHGHNIDILLPIILRRQKSRNRPMPVLASERYRHEADGALLRVR